MPTFFSAFLLSHPLFSLIPATFRGLLAGFSILPMHTSFRLVINFAHLIQLVSKSVFRKGHALPRGLGLLSDFVNALCNEPILHALSFKYWL
jgi:hypothetical protein